MDTKNTESEYEGFKKKGKVIAKILIIIGPFLVIGGIVSLILSFVSGASMDMDFDEFASAMELEGDLAFLGIGLLAGGGFMIIIGIWAYSFTHLGKITKYVADEVSPAAKTMTKAVAEGLGDGGGIKLDIDLDREPAKEKIMIKCRSCGALNDEDDMYCGKCGKTL